MVNRLHGCIMCTHRKSLASHKTDPTILCPLFTARGSRNKKRTCCQCVGVEKGLVLMYDEETEGSEVVLPSTPPTTGSVRPAISSIEDMAAIFNEASVMGSFVDISKSCVPAAASELEEKKCRSNQPPSPWITAA